MNHTTVLMANRRTIGDVNWFHFDVNDNCCCCDQYSIRYQSNVAD